MKFTFVPRREIPLAWFWLSRMLEAAVRGDPHMSMQQLYNDLVEGRSLCVLATGPGSGAIILELDDAATCWIKYLGGKVEGGPKRRMQVLRDGVAWVEAQAAAIGCSDVRICGRDWSMILTDYELMPDAPEPNLLRKALMKEAA